MKPEKSCCTACGKKCFTVGKTNTSFSGTIFVLYVNPVCGVEPWNPMDINFLYSRIPRKISVEITIDKINLLKCTFKVHC